MGKWVTAMKFSENSQWSRINVIPSTKKLSQKVVSIRFAGHHTSKICFIYWTHCMFNGSSVEQKYFPVPGKISSNAFTMTSSFGTGGSHLTFFYCNCLFCCRIFRGFDLQFFLKWIWSSQKCSLFCTSCQSELHHFSCEKRHSLEIVNSIFWRLRSFK